MVLTFFTVSESRDPNRPRSIDYAGSVLVALTLAPFILAVSKGGDWGWFSVATLVCFAIAVAAGFAFVAVERRVAVPMLDLALLRNRVLVGGNDCNPHWRRHHQRTHVPVKPFISRTPARLGFRRCRPVWRPFPRPLVLW